MEEHKGFSLAIVAIVAIVGVIGLVVIINGVPRQTELGQAVLRERQTATALSTERQLLTESTALTTEISENLHSSAEKIQLLAAQEIDLQKQSELLVASKTLTEAQNGIFLTSTYLVNEDFIKASESISKADAKIKEAKRLAKTETKQLKEVHPGIISAMENVAKFEKGNIGRTKALLALKKNLDKWKQESSATQEEPTQEEPTQQPPTPITTLLPEHCYNVWIKCSNDCRTKCKREYGEYDECVEAGDEACIMSAALGGGATLEECLNGVPDFCKNEQTKRAKCLEECFVKCDTAFDNCQRGSKKGLK